MARRTRGSKQRRDRGDVVSDAQRMELVCGPSSRGTAFTSPEHRERCRGLLGITPRAEALDRERRFDEIRERNGRGWPR